jgi:hypothetical protein
MTSVKDLEDYLARENPIFHWRCWEDSADAPTDYAYVEATINGRPIPHSPVHLSRNTLETMGLEATAWLISLELSPSRADVDWDKLAEV